MNRPLRRAAAGCALGLAAAVGLLGCAGSPPEGPTDLAPYLQQRVEWRDCPASDDFLDEIPPQAQCASVEVPVDYFDASTGRGSLDIALIRIPSDGPSSGSILVNPGGPGASGVDHVAVSAAALQRNLPGYDIVGFDPRGVARSAGFDCETGTQQRRSIIELDFTPEDAAEFGTNFEQLSAYEQACRQANPAWAYLGTSSVAQDVALISQVLGDAGINFYGVSYGSVIGYEVLRTFGDGIGRMILESPVDPAVENILAEQLAAFNAEIEDLLALCATPEYSYCGAGRTAEEVRADFIAALADIENPQYGTLTGNGAPSEALVYFGMLLPLYFERTEESAKLYLDAVHALINNDTASNFERWGYLYEGYDATQREFFTTDDIQGLVLCMDESEPAEEVDIAEERRKDEAELSAIAQGAPLLYAIGFSGAYLDDDRAYQPCSYAAEAFADPRLPDPLPQAAPVTNPEGVAVLVLGVSGDTATPYPWARTIADDLGVPLVTQETTGHGVYTESDNVCTRDVVAGYLASGTLPQEDMTC